MDAGGGGDYDAAFAQGMAYAAKARAELGDAENARGIYEVLMTKGSEIKGKHALETTAAMLGLLNVWEEESAAERKAHAPQVKAICARLLKMCDGGEDGAQWLHGTESVDVPYVGPMDARRLRLHANAHLGSMHHEMQDYDEALASFDNAIEAGEAGEHAPGAADARAELVMALNGKAQLTQSLALRAAGATPSEAVQTTGDVERQQTLAKDDLPDDAKRLFREATALGLRALQLARDLAEEEKDEEGDAAEDDGHGATSPMLLAIYCTLGDIAFTMRNKRLCTMNYTHAARQSMRCYGNDHPETKRVLALLSFAQSHTAVGKPVDAM